MESCTRAAIAAAVVLISIGCGEEPPTPEDADSDGGAGAVDVPDLESGDARDAVDGAVDVDGSGDALDAEAVDTMDVEASDGNGDHGSGADGGCMTDDMCPGNAVCDEGTCRYYRVVQIRDVTRTNSASSTEACNADDSGADLFELELRGPFGTRLGHARTVRAKLSAKTNTDAATVFDGTSNSLRQTHTGLCPSGGYNSSTVLSFGCDGTMVVVFTDGQGSVQGLSSGQQLVVHEYGRQCCDGDCPKEYWEVRVCSAKSPARFKNQMPDSDGHWPTCNTQILGVGTGRDQMTIRLPRP